MFARFPVRMYSQNPHRLIEQTAISLFEHEHLWLRLVAHVVLVIMPVVALFLVLRWMYLLAKWILLSQATKGPAGGNVANRFEVPAGPIGFIFKYSGLSQILMALFALSTLPITYA